MFSGLLYLYQLLSFYSTEGGTSWQYRTFVVYCDNKSLVQVVSAKVNRTHQEYVNESMESEWDIVQAIVKCIKQLGTVDLRHVKGHQTESRTTNRCHFPPNSTTKLMPMLPLSKSTPTTRSTSSFPLPGGWTDDVFHSVDWTC
jgi:hypothetical protein